MGEWKGLTTTERHFIYQESLLTDNPAKAAVLKAEYALRAALAQKDVCEWKDETAFFRSACDATYPTQEYGGNHPRDYMKFCFHCGKPIKFLESEE